MLITDGDCGFCQRSAAVLVARMRPAAHVAPYQQLDLAALGVTPTRAEREVLWVDTDGVRGGAAAVAAVLRVSPSRIWRTIGHVLAIPPVSWAAAGLYVLIARNRHRLPGGTAQCVVR